jgi:hypothetical protein
MMVPRENPASDGAGWYRTFAFPARQRPQPAPAGQQQARQQGGIEGRAESTLYGRQDKGPAGPPICRFRRLSPNPSCLLQDGMLGTICRIQRLD